LPFSVVTGKHPCRVFFLSLIKREKILSLFAAGGKEYPSRCRIILTGKKNHYSQIQEEIKGC